MMAPSWMPGSIDLPVTGITLQRSAVQAMPSEPVVAERHIAVNAGVIGGAFRAATDGAARDQGWPPPRGLEAGVLLSPPLDQRRGGLQGLQILRWLDRGGEQRPELHAVMGDQSSRGSCRTV